LTPEAEKKNTMSIEVLNITKSFGSFRALRDVSLKVSAGELVALLGPSGSGKTSLLRIIAGLESPDGGTVRLNEQDATQQSAGKRRVGFVFQHYALFRHLTVFENVAFGLRVKPRLERPSQGEIHDRVMRLLKLIQLDWLAQNYPHQLSGGQRQRVALARALAVEPKVLLLDEPFGSLDAKVRKELRRWLRRLHDEIQVASVFVTHDQEEALEVSDRVAIMNEGKIQQIGTPQEVYDHPANSFVYNFLGNVNLFHGRIQSGQASMGEMKMAAPGIAANWEGPAVGYARPYEIEITRQLDQLESALPAVVSYISTAGPRVKMELKRCDNGELVEAELSRDRFQELALKLGENVFVKPRHLKVFTEDYTI
jgi:sulfate/thiosulfate transport system ATP-binding protein